jgi:hypothetical protein
MAFLVLKSLEVVLLSFLMLLGGGERRRRRRQKGGAKAGLLKIMESAFLSIIGRSDGFDKASG